MQKVSIIVPVIRHDSAARCVEAINANAGIPQDQFEIVIESDTQGIGCPAMVKQLTEKTKYDLVCFLGDDTIPQPGFLRAALLEMSLLPDEWGVVGLNTEGGVPQAHWLAHKNMLELTGGEFFSTDYHHHYCDNELCDIAKEDGRWAWCESAYIEHDHPSNSEPGMIELSKEEYEKYREDENTYRKRKLQRYKKKGIERLGIAWPLQDDRLHKEFVTSWTIMEKPGQFVFLMPEYENMNIEDTRNNLVEQAFRSNCTHLIMMDTDQVYPFDTIPKLLSHKVDVCGVLVHRRYPPFDPILYRGSLAKYTHVPYDECYSGNLVEVDATGCGCLCYDMECFTDIKQPFFKMTTNDKGKTVGEDIHCCFKLREAGRRIFIDTSIEVDHLTLYRVNKQTALLYKKLKRFEWAE